MSKKVLINGIAGGIVMFIWGAISHMVLPLGETGMKAIPNEEAVLAAMNENMTETSVYLFPGFDPKANLTEEQMQAFYQKWEKGPTGFLVYHPDGLPAMSAKMLLMELAANIVSALIAACALGLALGTLKGFGSRVLFVMALGFVPFFAVDASYWIWYGFPTTFTLASMVEQVFGFGLAGLTMAAILRRSGV